MTRAHTAGRWDKRRAAIYVTGIPTGAAFAGLATLRNGCEDARKAGVCGVPAAVSRLATGGEEGMIDLCIDTTLLSPDVCSDTTLLPPDACSDTTLLPPDACSDTTLPPDVCSDTTLPPDLCNLAGPVVLCR